MLLFPLLSMAQGRIADIWTEPAVFVADEEVSIYFDITGTELAAVAEEQGVCVWTWYPADPGESWGNPSEDAQLEQVEGNIWKWVIVPTEFYGVDASSVNGFYGQLQTHGGDKIAIFAPDQDPPNHITMYGLTTIKTEGTILDYFPKDFTLGRPLSVLVNANNTLPDKCEGEIIPGELAGAPNVHVHAGMNLGSQDWEVVVENNPANSSKTELTHLGDGVYRWDFVPYDYFGVEDGIEVTNISAVFASNDWAYIGKNTDCSDFFITVPEQPEVAVPELLFFPSKISHKDLLSITRSDNEPFVSSMNYTITAGAKTLTGSFDGNNKTFVAYINLADALKDESDLDKVHIVLKDNTGRIVSENDLPLVQLD